MVVEPSGSAPTKNNAAPNRLRTIAACLGAFAALLLSRDGHAQAYPDRPISYIVPSSPGSSPDSCRSATLPFSSACPRVGLPSCRCPISGTPARPHPRQAPAVSPNQVAFPSLPACPGLSAHPIPSVYREVQRAEQAGLVTSRKVGNRPPGSRSHPAVASRGSGSACVAAPCGLRAAMTAMCRPATAAAVLLVSGLLPPSRGVHQVSCRR